MSINTNKLINAALTVAQPQHTVAEPSVKQDRRIVRKSLNAIAGTFSLGLNITTGLVETFNQGVNEAPRAWEWLKAVGGGAKLAAVAAWNDVPVEVQKEYDDWYAAQPRAYQLELLQMTVAKQLTNWVNDLKEI